MKQCILFIATLFAIPLVGNAQAELVTAFSKADAATVSNYLADKVDMSVNGSESVVDKQSAVQKLEQFFQNHKVTSFKTVHSGTSKASDSNYTIGELTTQNGNFRVYLYFGKRGPDSRIEELRIEPSRGD